jgi:hypothetical protein
MSQLLLCDGQQRWYLVLIDPDSYRDCVTVSAVVVKAKGHSMHGWNPPNRFVSLHGRHAKDRVHPRRQ